MPKRIDLNSVSMRRAMEILRCRRQKAREYQRKRDVIKARHIAWQKANRDKVTEIGRAWAEANPQRKAASTRASYERNRDAVLARRKADYENLVDSVVKGQFCQRTDLQSKDVPPELVPVIRTTMLIKRELKKAKTQ